MTHRGGYRNTPHPLEAITLLLQLQNMWPNKRLYIKYLRVKVLCFCVCVSICVCVGVRCLRRSLTANDSVTSASGFGLWSALSGCLTTKQQPQQLQEPLPNKARKEAKTVFLATWPSDTKQPMDIYTNVTQLTPGPQRSWDENTDSMRSRRVLTVHTQVKCSSAPVTWRSSGCFQTFGLHKS